MVITCMWGACSTDPSYHTGAPYLTQTCLRSNVYGLRMPERNVSKVTGTCTGSPSVVELRQPQTYAAAV